jgi:hypothetical protein
MTARAGYVAALIVGPIAALGAIVALAMHANVAKTVTEVQQGAWVLQASAGLEPPVIDTLNRIVKADRRLLALRAYLRAGGELSARWTWSQERQSGFLATADGKAAANDIDAVAAAFALANPGFTLRVTRMPRSLDLQLMRWNENASVGAAAAALTSWLGRRFSGAGAAPSSAELREALIAWPPSSTASIAAPGLSAHGQGRVFDFQVEHRGRIVAGVDVSSARHRWDAAGWTQKLHNAIGMAGDHFSGPLLLPYEPWHYSYQPVAALSDPVAR